MTTQNQNQVNHVYAEDFAQLMQDENTVLIDVRTPGEYMSGRIGEARNIDLMSPAFTTLISELPKDKTCLVYCAGGNRSSTAASFMVQNGFSKVYNLMGGIMNWPFDVK